MKVTFKSFFRATVAGALVGFVFLILLPFLLIESNNYLYLPKFDSLTLDILGMTMVIIGIVLFLYCSNLFVKLGQGTPAPIEPPKKLVKNNIYNYTRNPMYLGYFFIVLGEFFILGHFILFFYFLSIVLLINLYLIFVEEPKLKKRFGLAYDNYCKQVPRWFKIDF